jgi:hypothetical protein
MPRILKWTGTALLLIATGGFLAFLYHVPPFLTAPPETFSRPVAEAAPPIGGIADPALRAIAERGRYLVMTAGCIGCHATNGPRGPDYTKYLAGGGTKFVTPRGTFISRNLTPDEATGLGRRTDDEIKRVLRSGVFPDGHVAPYTVMPWANFSNWSEEDRHAIVVYLRSLPPVPHEIPEPDSRATLTEPGATERAHAGRDYGLGPAP